MYINFPQNWVSRSVKTVRTNIFAKIASCIDLQLYQYYFFKNQLLHTCITIKRTCMSIFTKIRLIDQSKPCTQICLQNLQLAIRILKNHAFRTCTTP